MSNYLEELNETQRMAVEYLDGPSLVIAGAGSGKTRVLTYKIVHLLYNGYKPWEILALTFTNKAAREMKERIAAIIGHNQARYLWMGTFHSIFAKILRSEADAIGFPANFTIYDTVDSKNLIKTIVKELKLNDKDYPPNEVFARISNAKNNLITASAYANMPELNIADLKAKKPHISKIFKIYENRCKLAGAMDFDDLLLYTNILFRDNPDILDKYQNKFKFILVDEYQDTNFAQYLIVKRLTAKHGKICVVGDDAQSIYSFRGAKIENILNFKKDYPNYKLFKLEQNYRSTKTIVGAANSVIDKNKNQIKKNVFSENDEGNKIKVFATMADVEEGIVVANKIAEMHLTEHFDFKDFAILYRTNAQSRIFEEALRKRNIPYRIYGGMSFYQRKEIKDILAYFRVIVNPDDSESLKRIINYPKRGIGQTTVDKIYTVATHKQISFWKVLTNFWQYGIDLTKRSANSIVTFVNMMKNFMNKMPVTDALTLANEVVNVAGIYKDLYKDKSIEGLSRYENMQELINGIREFVENNEKQTDDSVATLSIYLEEVSLMTNDDNEDEDKNKVHLMTVHSAKGLEFKNVFVVGLEEGLFPSTKSVESSKDIEEERRLFYVAVTRAETNLFLSYATARYKWGQLTIGRPSRFLSEIDPDFIEQEPVNGLDFAKKTSSFNHRKTQTATNLKRIDRKNVNQNNTSQTVGKLKVGTIVKHPRFGRGKILAIEGDNANLKAKIDFDAFGQKLLLLKFAKLEILD